MSRLSILFPMALVLAAVGCGRQPVVSADGLPLRRVVVYRNGVAYFERSGHVEENEVRFKMKETEVGDFLATLAVIEKGGSSVRSAAFPLKVDDEEKPKPHARTPDEKRGLKQVVLALDGKAHDLEIGYVAESPVWRPSYRLVVEKSGEAYLQAWGIVQNLSGEDWRDVKLSLVAGAPLAFEAQLGQPVVPSRPVVTDQGEVIAAVPRGDTSLRSQPGDRDGDGIPDDVDRCPDGAGDGDGCPEDEKTAKAFKAEAKKDVAANKPSAGPRSRAGDAKPSGNAAPAPPPPPP